MARRHEPGAKPDLRRGRHPDPRGPRARTFDLGQSLYDRPVEVAFAARLRPEERFPSAAALVAQIARDIESARPILTPTWLAHAVLGATATWEDDHG
ncbi:riboflavin kinase [Nannocystis pusilla]|uniref:riboflavin kinase n=1 Tax=Nannocystis pusilla TaxID=889268 RepID=UPI003DA421BB